MKYIKLFDYLQTGRHLWHILLGIMRTNIHLLRTKQCLYEINNDNIEEKIEGLEMQISTLLIFTNSHIFVIHAQTKASVHIFLYL